MSNPTISVVMAVYNGEKYLAEAIQSILDQTFSDFEFIIVDDGSTDGSSTILSTYLKSDDRIRVLKNETKQGLSFSLNKAIKASGGEFIARMDADDVSLPNRLEAQYQIFVSDQNKHLVGTAVDVVDRSGVRMYGINPPEDGKQILWSIASGLRIPFIHPSVMFRRDFFSVVGGYDETYPAGQDFELWSRLITKDISDHWVLNLNERLLKYRQHDDIVSKVQREIQITRGMQTRANLRSYMIFCLGNKNLPLSLVEYAPLSAIDRWLASYELANISINYFSKLRHYQFLLISTYYTKSLYYISRNAGISSILRLVMQRKIRLTSAVVLLVVKGFGKMFSRGKKW